MSASQEPNIQDQLTLTDRQQHELRRGLTIISGVGFSMLAGAVYNAYRDHIESATPDVGEHNTFSYLRDAAELEIFDNIGKGLLHTVTEATGYGLRTDSGDIVENSGFILYPPNDPGTGKHSDIFWGDTLVRLSLPLSSTGNFWSVTTGERKLGVGDLLIQDLSRSPEHHADTLGVSNPRAVAFWDLPAARIIR